MSKPVIYAMIPARMGSTRLKMKNLALIDGKPMISYAIKAARDSGVFEKVKVNSENIIFDQVAQRYGADFYHREESLGSSVAKSDDVVADFMKSHPEAEVVVWVNSTSPFQTAEEVAEVVDYFNAQQLDSLITVENKQVHCDYSGEPVNYDIKGKFSQTQDMTPVQPFVYSIMMWRTSSFMEEYKEKGYALFCGQFGTYPVRKLTEIIIKNQDDLMRVDLLMTAINANSENYTVRYDGIIA